MPYLDVIHRLRSSSVLPIAAYHVSGEYAMMKAAAQKVRISLILVIHIKVAGSIVVCMNICMSMHGIIWYKSRVPIL